MLPLGFNDWVPSLQAATLGLLTFVQEDVPTVTAALLAAAGTLAWQVGWLGCFLGIWIGDALLYCGARCFGRPLLDKPWARRLCNPAAVTRSEQWFAEKGAALLVISRFVPGTRLPTYVAAGFLRLPLAKFLLVTGAAAAGWTMGIFCLAKWLGADLLKWIDVKNCWFVPLFVIALIVGVARLRRAFRHWEFWPAWLFYIPVVANYLRLAICHRSFTVPTAANPGMFAGGFVGESKIATLRELQRTSPEFTAEARVFNGTAPFDYPFILKPDVGQRGVGVKLIRSPDQLSDYLEHTNAPLIIQRYAPGPHEAGVFYYRFPDETRGRIFAITEKVFPVITGDGERTIEELIRGDSRARFMAKKYLQRLSRRRAEVLAKGEHVKLVEAGNHAQGCIFRDGSHFWSPELEDRVDEISQRLGGFYIGRYDIRYASHEDLRVGRNFQIIELNGASSEATSIYDARNSVFSAYRTLVRQWNLVFAIGAANRLRGWSPTPLTALWRRWRQTAAMIRTYPLAD